MSVAGVGSGVDLYSVLQQLNGSSQTTDISSSIAASSADPDGDGTTQAASGHHHHGGHHGGGISSKVESAVTSALQNAPAGSDPNQVIQSAIQDALTGSTDTTNQSTTASLIDNGTSPSALSTSSTDSFNQLLQSFGVDPKQFHQDFQAAVQNVSQDGSVNFATLFQSFPPGSSVDAVG